MVFQTIEELNRTLLDNPRFSYGRLSLENYLLLIAGNEATDNFLITLEDNGHLPRTVAWFTENQSYKVRLYQRAEGFKTGDFFFFGRHMVFVTDHDKRLQLPARSSGSGTTMKWGTGRCCAMNLPLWTRRP